MNGDAAVKTVPWIVALKLIRKYENHNILAICTASLITDEHLLTAGHCYCKEGIIRCTAAEAVSDYSFYMSLILLHNWASRYRFFIKLYNKEALYITKVVVKYALFHYCSFYTKNIVITTLICCSVPVSPQLPNYFFLR